MGRALIRVRITVMAVVAVVVVLAGVSVALVIAQRVQLTAALDANLRQRADDIAALLAAPDSAPERFGASQEEGFVQLVGADGAVIAASPNLAGFRALETGYRLGAVERLVTAADVPIDDDAFRVLSRTITAAGQPAVLHVGTTYDVVGESTESLASSLLIATPLVILILGGLVWWVAGRTLRPVEEIRAEVASIGPNDLRRRVSEPTGGDEIASLAATMNLMLGRIEEAVSRQQEFVADASHELRSPLTRMRSEIEVDLASGAAPGRHRLESLRDEVEELQRLVEDLLLLARADAGAGGFDAVAVDLDDIVFEEGRMVREVGRVQVDMAAVSAAQVLGEKRQLRRAIHNLVDNAGRYAESRVELALAEVNGSAELVVVNDGPGIPDEQVERIFERFTRVDDSRARHSGGSGLGLAIARSIARRHGGDLTLEPSIWAEARFVMRIPTP